MSEKVKIGGANDLSEGAKLRRRRIEANVSIQEMADRLYELAKKESPESDPWVSPAGLARLVAAVENNEVDVTDDVRSGYLSALDR